MFVVTNRAIDIPQVGLVRIAVREILRLRALCKLFQGSVTFQAARIFNRAVRLRKLLSMAAGADDPAFCMPVIGIF